MAHRPPELTATSRFFVRLLDTTDRWSRRRAWATAIAMMAATLTIERATPATVSTAVLYMIATAFAVWALNQRAGLLLGLVTVVAGTFIKHREVAAMGLPPLGAVTELWNTVARFLSASVLAMMVNGLRSALALERWRASSDGLTGVLNKMAFEERMRGVVTQARLQNRSLVLSYMDLDGFKGVNDRHGHSAGDRVLRAFAAAATQSIRSSDLFARIGGDEFVALMSVRSCNEGDSVAAMLHGRLTAILRETGFDVTCSMGALVSEAHHIDTDGMLELADMLMYEVKRSGKNALRLARAGGKLSATLRNAYRAPADDDLRQLLERIDCADRAYREGQERRMAA